MAHKVSNSVAILVGGSVVGASLALLFAPFSGTKSRKKLADFGKAIRGKSDRSSGTSLTSLTLWVGKLIKYCISGTNGLSEFLGANVLVAA